MPFFNSGKQKLYYEESGTGVPLIFLHGFSLNGRMWKGQVDYFSGKYRVIAYDARGHGKSDSPETGYSREERAGDLMNLAVSLGLPQFHLVGLSMGGGDALCFAVEHQDRLLSLTLVATVASGYTPTVQLNDYTAVLREKGLVEAKRMYIESSLSRYGKQHEKIKVELEMMMNEFSGSYWLDPMMGKYPKRDDVLLSARVRIPTLIVAGKNDISWMPLAKILNEKMLDSRLKLLSGVGHMVNLEAPEIFNKILEEFLTEIKVTSGIDRKENVG